jgi:hypothetical protein
MIKLLLEQYRVSYLPIESVSMQERVRAVEFVLGRAGMRPVVQAATTRAMTDARTSDGEPATLPAMIPTPAFDVLRAAIGGDPMRRVNR